MKTIQTVLLFAFMLLSIHTISAQYGNNGYGNNGYGGNGYGNRMNSGMGQDRQPQKPREIPVEETVGKIMDQFKTEINLDELQVIAISNVFTESIREQGILLKNESNSQEDKIKEIEALSETTNRKIMGFLNPDQKEKFLVLIEENKNPKKAKSKKKKK
jgi:hypothetical protein